MTAKVTRFAGAILLETAAQFFLIGNTKEPCDWRAAGFDTPEEIDAVKCTFFRLSPYREIYLPSHCLLIVSDQNGEALAQILAGRFLIRRNGSVSERLWRIVTGETEEEPLSQMEPFDISWLISMPERVWDIVRDTALKCL